MRLDDYLPSYQFCARYEVSVNAPADRIWDALLAADFSQSRIISSLMRLRTLGRKARAESTSMPLLERMSKAGFTPLEVRPPQELLIGVIGRFWQFDSGIMRGWHPHEFCEFSQPGFAKAVWNFSLTVHDGATTLSTETRIQTLSTAATRTFRLYWFFVGPFSGLIRHQMLKMVKRAAEESAP